MKIIVNQASGSILNYLVAKAEELNVIIECGSVQLIEKPDQSATVSYDDWAQAGPIIGQNDIELTKIDKIKWHAKMERIRGITQATAEFQLLAAMRCYVKGFLGDEVDIPDDLISIAAVD